MQKLHKNGTYKLQLERHVEKDHDRILPCDLSFDSKDLLNKHIIFHNNLYNQLTVTNVNAKVKVFMTL